MRCSQLEEETRQLKQQHQAHLRAAQQQVDAATAWMGQEVTKFKQAAKELTSKQQADLCQMATQLEIASQEAKTLRKQLQLNASQVQHHAFENARLHHELERYENMIFGTKSHRARTASVGSSASRTTSISAAALTKKSTKKGHVNNSRVQKRGVSSSRTRKRGSNSSSERSSRREGEEVWVSPVSPAIFPHQYTVSARP